MFGIASFSQVPFASLAGNVFALSITENLNSADASTQQSAFLQSITEVFTSNDIDTTSTGLFFASINETFTSDDASAQQSAFLQSIS